MLLLKQPLILPSLYHKSATTSQIDSYKISNAKLKPDRCNCVKTEITKSTAPLQQQHKGGTIFGTPCKYKKNKPCKNKHVKGEGSAWCYEMMYRLKQKCPPTTGT